MTSIGQRFTASVVWSALVVLALVLADTALRVWVPPAQAPVAGDQTEKVLSRSLPAAPGLASPFDPFYDDVATKGRQQQADAATAEQSETPRQPVFDYRVLAVAETEGDGLRTVIRVNRREGEDGKESKPEAVIETLSVGDSIGDASVTSISERQVRLQSESLGSLTLTLFFPPGTGPSGGPVPVNP